MITLVHPTTGQARRFYLHLASYAYGGLTWVVLSADPDPSGAWSSMISENADPERVLSNLPPDHFFLNRTLAFPIRQAVVAQRIIEAVPAGTHLPTGQCAYRLCAGILPDTDQRGDGPGGWATARQIEILAHLLHPQQTPMGTKRKR